MFDHYRASLRAAPLHTMAGLACFIPALSLVVSVLSLTIAVELNNLTPDFFGADLLGELAAVSWGVFTALPGSVGWKLLEMVILSVAGVKFLLDADRLVAVDLTPLRVEVFPEQAIRPKKPRHKKMIEAPPNSKE